SSPQAPPRLRRPGVSRTNCMVIIWRMRNHLFCSAILPILLVIAASAAAQTSGAGVRALVDGPTFRQASAFIATDQDRFLRELIQLTEIAAPPFKEQARAKAFEALLGQAGLTGVEIDADGNVTGLRRGAGTGLLVVNAHLDTVFPE